MRGEKHHNARMEISEHGKIVREDFSRGGLYVVRTWKDCKGIGMTLMWEEKTRTGDKNEGFCTRTGVS